MLKIENTKERNLPLICKEHYAGILPTINRVLNGSKLRFNKVIKTEIKKNIEEIITGSPRELIILEEKLYKFIFSFRKDKKLIDYELKRIFDYPAFRRWAISKKWNPYKLAKRLNTRTCVYCNRQYTFTVDEGSSKITRPQFDHFFSQENHPLLALSFYNLIPCCSICNLRKSNKELLLSEYLHPYENEYGENGIFTWVPKNYRALVGRSDEMEVKIVTKPNTINGASILKQKDFFKLDEIYTEHSDFVQEIILKAHISKGQYFKWLRKLFGKGISKEDLYRIAMNNYGEKKTMDKRVLSKLTFDIAKELNLVM